MAVNYRDNTPFEGDNHTVGELAEAIRTKMYGVDVREPIAQAVEKMENWTKGNNIGNIIATPTKVFANLSALQTAYPNGADGVMVTADNGHKYFWSNNQWTDGGVYQSSQALDALESPGAYLGPNQTTLQNADNAKGNTVYRLVFANGATSGIVANTPFGNKWNSPHTMLLITIGNNAIGATQHFIDATNMNAWSRTKSGNGWSDWTAKLGADYQFIYHPMQTFLGSASQEVGAITDLNEIKRPGVYTFNATAGSTNIPANTPYGSVWGAQAPATLTQIGNGSVGTSQVFQELGPNPRTWIRYKAQDWREWELSSSTTSLPGITHDYYNATTLPDLNGITRNGIYPIVIAGGSTDIPDNTPWNTWPDNHTQYLFQIGSGTSLASWQILYNIETGSRWERQLNTASGEKAWGAWADKTKPDGGRITIQVGANKTYTSVKEAVDFAMQDPKKYRVEIFPGEYDLIAEFGQTYFEQMSASNGEQQGLRVGGGLEIYAYPGAKIKANYNGTNSVVESHFSPFNHSIQGGITFEGLDIEASRVRYIFHDELVGKRNSKTIIKNCRFVLDNSSSTTWKHPQTIGGGLGYDADINIRNSFFSGKGQTGDYADVVSYHNHGQDNSESRITISNSYFTSPTQVATVRFGYYGPSQQKTKVMLSGNSWSKEPVKRAETGSSEVDNFEIISFNNELRSN